MSTGFRVALAGYIVLALTVSSMALFLGPQEMPEPAAAYIHWWNSQPLSGLENFALWVGLGAASLSIVAAAGMAFFASWSRHLFVVAVAVLVVNEGLVQYPVLKSSLEFQLDSLVGLLAGGIVAVSYWSSISEKFHAKSP